MSDEDRSSSPRSIVDHEQLQAAEDILRQDSPGCSHRTSRKSCKYISIAQTMRKLLKKAEHALDQILLAREMARDGYDYITFQRLDSLLRWHESTMELLFVRITSLLGFKDHDIRAGERAYRKAQHKIPRAWKMPLAKIEYLWQDVCEETITETYLWRMYEWSAWDFLICIHKFHIYRFPFEQIKRDDHNPVGWFNGPCEVCDLLVEFRDHVEVDIVPDYNAHENDFRPDLNNLMDEDQYPPSMIVLENTEFPLIPLLL